MSYPSTAPASYSFEVTFSAKGSFSVNNPVDVKIVITDSNISDFGNNYVGAGFLGANKYPITESTGTTSYISGIPFTNTGNGTYTAEGTFIWAIEGASRFYIVPKNHPINIVPHELSPSETMITISGVADTLSMRFTESTAKLTWLLGSFSILVLAPVVEAIVVREKSEET